MMDESFSEDATKEEEPAPLEPPVLVSPSSSKKSIYWIHYLEYDNDIHPEKKGIARCKICGKDIKCNQGTGGIKKHLSYKHPKEHDALEGEKDREENNHEAETQTLVKDVIEHMNRSPLVRHAPPKKKMKTSFAPTVSGSQERRSQEKHWMDMWMTTSRELTRLRQESKEETDEEVMEEIREDILGLRKKKADFARRLGMLPLEEDQVQV